MTCFRKPAGKGFRPSNLGGSPAENSLAKSRRTNHPTRCSKTAFYAMTAKCFIDLMLCFLCLCINLLVEIQFFRFLHQGRPKCTCRIMCAFYHSFYFVGFHRAKSCRTNCISSDFSLLLIYLPIPCKPQPYCVVEDAGRAFHGALPCASKLLCNTSKRRILATPGGRFDPRDA